MLFEENHYAQLVQKEIAYDLLLTDGENQMVSIPSVDCVLGDKLTAFAPYTTGILLRKNKDITPADALMDSIQAAVCIGSHGKSNEDDMMIMKSLRRGSPCWLCISCPC